jgi:hypothetical protein
MKYLMWATSLLLAVALGGCGDVGDNLAASAATQPDRSVGSSPDSVLITY